jgi:hypothetical protein
MTWIKEYALSVKLNILWRIDSLLSLIKAGPEESQSAENAEKNTIDSIEKTRKNKK